MKSFSIKYPFTSLRNPLAMILAVLSFFTPVHAADVEKKSDEYLSAESNHKALDFISDYATELIVGTCVAVTAASLLAWRFFPRSSGSIGAGGNDDAKSTPLPAELDKLVLAKNLVEGSPEYAAAVESINADLKRRRSIVWSACTNNGFYVDEKSIQRRFGSVWEALKYLLVSDDIIEYVENNYPEWRIRLSPGGEYNRWVQEENGRRCGTYQCMQLMSIAYVLRLAALVNYHPVNSNNICVYKKEALEANVPDLKPLDTCEDSDSVRKKRLKKVIVEDNDILRSAHRFLLNNPEYCRNGAIGVLNAGDRRLTSGCIPGWGCALEEYLATMTTLLSDISYEAVIAGQSESDDSVFYNRGFEAVCGFKDWRLTSDELLERARKYLTGKIMPEGFYDVLVSKNVRLIRGLGNVNARYGCDPSFPFNNPTKKDYISDFSPPKDGLGSISFSVVSVGGLEDRSNQINILGGGVLRNYGEQPVCVSNSDLGTIRGKWAEITEKQCELVLIVFILLGVKVPFLCAFGAGAFGGDAELVAKCWYKVLITKGYIDYFDKVVFPIGYSKYNYQAFDKVFSKSA